MPVPVTRLLGQSLAGLSATGDSDTRNYYDMIAARQELDLRPQLERLDRLILASEGLDPDAVSFAFRPLWQMDASTAATVALTKAQATQIYAGLGLWPTAVTARLVEAQVIADGTYPNAAAVFAEARNDRLGSRETDDASPVRSGYGPAQPRNPDGRWSGGGSISFSHGTERPESSVSTQEDILHLTATTKDFQHACRVLKLDPIEASDALHAARHAHGLSGADNCLFDLDSGDIIFNGEPIGRYIMILLYDFVIYLNNHG